MSGLISELNSLEKDVVKKTKKMRVMMENEYHHKARAVTATFQGILSVIELTKNDPIALDKLLEELHGMTKEFDEWNKAFWITTKRKRVIKNKNV